MFLFIVTEAFNILSLTTIQIHLMFLFISIASTIIPGIANSNTSYVLIYRSLPSLSFKQITIQIHLMFLFITCLFNYRLLIRQFKYILCSYLSTVFQLIRQALKHSNTSYVLIYQDLQDGTFVIGDEFKYILCSYLSSAFDNDCF